MFVASRRLDDVVTLDAVITSWPSVAFRASAASLAAHA
jgi:hypothetical protein